MVHVGSMLSRFERYDRNGTHSENTHIRIQRDNTTSGHPRASRLSPRKYLSRPRGTWLIPAIMPDILHMGVTLNSLLTGCKI